MEADKQRWQKNWFSFTWHMTQSFTAAYFILVEQWELAQQLFWQSHKLQNWNMEFDLSAE